MMQKEQNRAGRARVLPAVAAMSALVVFAVSANIVFACLVRAAADVGVRPELFANVSAAQFLGFFVTAAAGGVVADRIGKQPVLQLACVMIAVGAVAWSCSHTVAGVYAASIALGMGGGALESMSLALLTDLFPHRRRLFLNLSQVAYCAGAVGGPAVMARLMPTGVSWRVFFIVTAGAAGGLLCLFSLCRMPRPASGQAADERLDRAAFHRTVWRWSFVAPCLGLFLYVFSEMSVATFSNVFLQQHYAAPEFWAVSSIALFWGAMTVGRVGCALIPEHVRGTRIIPALLVAAAMCLAAQGAVSSWPVSLTFFALTGLCFSGSWPLMIGLTAGLNPRYSGTVVGITVACGSLGCVMSPPIVGRLLCALHPPLVFTALALPLLIAALVIGLARPPPAGGLPRITRDTSAPSTFPDRPE